MHTKCDRLEPALRRYHFDVRMPPLRPHRKSQNMRRTLMRRRTKKKPARKRARKRAPMRKTIPQKRCVKKV
jgi:hypothetical protein